MSGLRLQLGGRTRLVLAGLAILAAGLLAAPPVRASDRVYYYSSDALHSEVVITDQNRNVVERTHYAPYGEVLNRPLREGPGYTGHAEDPGTGLVYMQQRYYDPVAGRFLSSDPVPASAGAGFNRYAYASNNPYGYYDPDGRASEKTKKQVEDINKPCTGSHIGGQACATLNLSTTQVGSERVSEQNAAAQRHYSLHGGAKLSPYLTQKADEISDSYNSATGQNLTVTDGLRAPADQARAMYYKITHGEGVRIYSNRKAANEILRSYNNAISHGLGPASIMRAMTETIDSQVHHGVYISYHLSGNAMDFRSFNMTASQRRSFIRSAYDSGASKVLDEGVPPHFHVQFDGEN
jgi:RHS repeat-associated protein